MTILLNRYFIEIREIRAGTAIVDVEICQAPIRLIILFYSAHSLCAHMCITHHHQHKSPKSSMRQHQLKDQINNEYIDPFNK